MGIKHAFVSQKSDEGDSSLIRPSNWNADHNGNNFPTLIVAANNASTKSKAGADYICDGTSDQTEIQAAINSLPTNVGGRILLTEGNFKISSSININRHGVILEGVGWGDPVSWSEDCNGSTLTATSGITNAVIYVTTGTLGTNNPVASCQIKSLMIDGKGTAGSPVGTNVNGISFSAFSSLIQDVRTCFMSGDGIYVIGKTVDPTWSTYNTRIQGLLAHHNTGNGLRCDSYGEDLQIIAVVAHNNGGNGYYTTGSSNQVSNSHFYDNGAGTNYNIRSGSTAARGKIVCCKIEHAEGIGVLVEGWETIFEACNFHNNGDPSGGSGTRHLKVASSGGATVIVGNRFGIKNSEYSMGAAIELASSSSSNFIAANSFQGTYTNVILNNGSSTKAVANQGASDI